MLSTLELRFSPTPVRAPVAWFFPSTDVSLWLEELARCGLADSETRLYVVPQTIRDRTPAGLLIVPKCGAALRTTPRGLACGVVAERLFLPIDAIVHPPLTDAEARDLFPLDVTFFHPSLGAAAFSPEEALHIWDLLETPPEAAGNWNRAQVAPAYPAQFRGIVLAQPPTPENLFGEESRDIGSLTEEPLPPAPDEPVEGNWSDAGRKARQAFASMIAKLTAQLPHTGTRRTWINDLEDWAARQAHSVATDLDRLRNKEMHRLLNLLRTDPETGLRHSIPFNQFGHRGRGKPGAKLGEHDLHFDPNRLGGGPADFWNVPPDLQAELIRQYRELADRETRLGRHRRAAYIYAELLGDLVCAANALKQGGHFREAALLYEERLNNPLAAAECLADAGLIHEAIERYEKLGHVLTMANLYERVGETDKANACLRRVVDEKLASGEPLEAAKLLEQRLQVPDEAAAVLEEAWPSSRQAVQCLKALFDLHARLRQYDAAAAQIRRLRLEEITSSRAEPVAKMLAELASKYPEPRVRAAAGDQAQVLVARELSRPALKSADAGDFVRVLSSLAPHDRLLARDGNRFVANVREREDRARRLVLPAAATQSVQPKLIRTFELPRPIRWMRVRSDAPWFYAAGLSGKRLTVVRGVWEGDIQSASWSFGGVAAGHALILEPVRNGKEHQLIVSAPAREAFKVQSFPATDLFFSRSCSAGTPAWIPQNIFPVAASDSAIWSVHIASGQAILSCYDFEGALVQTLDITTELLSDATRTEETRLCLTAFSAGAAVALGDRLVVLHRDGATSQFQLPGQVKELLPPLPHARVLIVALLVHGATLHCLGSDYLVELSRDTAFLSGTWIPSGKLVLIAEGEGRLLDVDSRGVHGVKRFAATSQDWFAVSPAGEPDEFAVFSPAGYVSVFKSP
jgi:tetratricopeptide (TPR) repeat protein